jgi:effector-binding domain-containing protein
MTNDENKKETLGLPKDPVDRRKFLKGAAGAMVVAGAIGLDPLLRGTSANAAPVSGSLVTTQELTRSSLTTLTHYVSIRHLGPFQQVNATWARLTQFALQQGISGPHVIAFAAACPCDDINAPVAAAKVPIGSGQLQLQYDACLAISAAQHNAITREMTFRPGDNFAGLRAGTIRVGDTMMTVHRGPYSTIGDTYRSALAAGATLGTSPDGKGLPVAFEVYKNNPLLTDPESLITEIHFPLRIQSLRDFPVTATLA